jgi:peptide deformylase
MPTFCCGLLHIFKHSKYLFHRNNTKHANKRLSSSDYPEQDASAPKLLRYGNPILFEKSLPFDLPHEFPEVMKVLNLMNAATKGLGNVGIAAPQIGILRRLVMFEVPAQHLRYNTGGVAYPMRIMINPVYKSLSNETNLGWEGCLSVPGMMGQVRRFSHIECEYIDLQGNKQIFQASDFHARVVQHEIDHLDGILYPLLVEDKRYFGYTEEILNSPEYVKDKLSDKLLE